MESEFIKKLILIGQKNGLDGLSVVRPMMDDFLAEFGTDAAAVRYRLAAKFSEEISKIDGTRPAWADDFWQEMRDRIGIGLLNTSCLSLLGWPMFVDTRPQIGKHICGTPFGYNGIGLHTCITGLRNPAKN